MTNNNGWMAVCRELDIAKPTIALSHIVRYRYMRYLYLFEIEIMKTPRSALYVRTLERPCDPGDKVIVFHEPSGREYDAKVLDLEMDTSKWDFIGRYYVHYNGWNSKYVFRKRVRQTW